jgi:hypothetical protein
VIASISSSACEKARKHVEKVGFMKSAGSDVDIDAKCVRKYEFKSNGRHREVSLAHVDGVWHIKVDWEVVATKSHSNSVLKPYRTSVDFPIRPLADESAHGEPLMASITMSWIPRSARWEYALSVNGTDVQESWSKSKGICKESDAVEISV